MLQVQKFQTYLQIKMPVKKRDFQKMSSVGSCYNQIGNAVAVPMIKGVGKQIIKQLFLSKGLK